MDHLDNEFNIFRQNLMAEIESKIDIFLNEIKAKIKGDTHTTTKRHLSQLRVDEINGATHLYNASMGQIKKILGIPRYRIDEMIECGLIPAPKTNGKSYRDIRYYFTLDQSQLATAKTWASWSKTVSPILIQDEFSKLLKKQGKQPKIKHKDLSADDYLSYFRDIMGEDLLTAHENT